MPMNPDNKQYIFNLETTKIELHFDKADYDALSDEQKREIKSAFLWSNRGKCWVSRAKEPNLYRAKQVAAKLGFVSEQREGERLTYGEQLERQAVRAEARADRYDGYAANAEKHGEQLQKPLNDMHGDISFFTQPHINSSAGRAFSNYRNRLYARYNSGFEEYRKSDYFKDRAQTARETASNAQFSNPGYLDRRIKECKKEIRAREKNIVHYEEALDAIDSGVEKKKANGQIATAAEVTSWIERELELIEKAMDKQGYLENCLDEIGGNRFNRDNIKIGYVVDIGKYGPVEVIGAGPQNIGYKILSGGAEGMSGTAAYAEIREIIKAEERKPDTHPFEVGEKFTAVHREYPENSMRAIETKIVYEIIKASDTTIRLKPIDADGKEITRKPLKTYSGKWRFSINDTYGNTFYKEAPQPSRSADTQERPSTLDKLASAKEAATRGVAEKPDTTKKTHEAEL